MTEAKKEILVEMHQQYISYHRYFMNWRERIYAGYLACMVALGYTYYHVLDEHTFITMVIAILSLFLSVVFLIPDIRERDLAKSVVKAASNIERKLSVDVRKVCCDTDDNCGSCSSLADLKRNASFVIRPLL